MAAFSSPGAKAHDRSCNSPSVVKLATEARHSCGRAGLLPGGASALGSLPIWIQQVRGWISTQQLRSWHALHCLLTVIFLLDFIKTPSVVRADKESEQKHVARHGEEQERRGWLCVMELCCRTRLPFQEALLGLGSYPLTQHTYSPALLCVSIHGQIGRKPFALQMKLAVQEPGWNERQLAHAWV